MSEESWAERQAREELERRAAREEWERKRAQFREALFGSADPLLQQKPQGIADFDGLLRIQAAQLRNAIDYLMEDILRDSASREDRALAVTTVTRMIQTNVAIAKTLAGPDSKTVHGGDSPKDPQD